MHLVGYATKDEILKLEHEGFVVEDAEFYQGVVGRNGEGVSEGYLLPRKEPNEEGTRAVVVQAKFSVFSMLIKCVVDRWSEDGTKTHLVYQHFSAIRLPKVGSLTAQAFVARRNKMRVAAEELRADAENFKYCSHKNSDGSDARYPIGNGELACDCGNKWD
jgi:hypothetical protein